MRKRFKSNNVERQKRIKANFAMYDGIKAALQEHDQLDADFTEALSRDGKLK